MFRDDIGIHWYSTRSIFLVNIDSGDHGLINWWDNRKRLAESPTTCVLCNNPVVSPDVVILAEKPMIRRTRQQKNKEKQ